MPLADGTMLSATYRCLECGEPMGLQNHQVNPDGSINPSVVCPHPVRSRLTGQDMRTPTLDCPKCSFHDYVQLVGWISKAMSGEETGEDQSW